jgi:hypothetical protein
MSFEGTIVNGHVELDSPIELPEGTRVRVEPVAKQEANADTPAPKFRPNGTPIPDFRPDGTPLTPLNKFLLSIAGVVKDWPPDMSVNHDHYIHGTRKRQP